MPETETSSQQVGAVAIKLPNFWVKMPEGWFARAESQFRRAAITVEETKYDHVMSVLPEEVIADIYDVIEENTLKATQYPILRRTDPDTPVPTPYTDLKAALISRKSASETERLEQILSRETLGSRKPSEFMRHLKSVRGTSQLVSDELILKLWMRALPQQVQHSLITSGKKEVNELTSLADLLFGIVSPSANNVFSVTNPSDDRMSRVEQQISALTQMVQEMKVNSQGAPKRGRSRSKKRSTNPTPNPSTSEKVCFYHRKYKEKAHRCVSPCNFPKSEN